MKKIPALPPEKTSKKKFSTKNKNKLIKATIKKITPKYILTLRILLNRSLVELEAFKLYGETCLHSTISTLANKKGVRFHRKSEPHKHQNGGVTHFTRYTLFDEDREKAKALIKPFEASNDDW